MFIADLHPPFLIFSLVHVWLSVCKEKGGHKITHSASDRSKCSRPAGARGFVFHPFFRAPAVVWVCQAQWCCCYKYASTSVSKWQLYSGPRTHCLGTIRVNRSKKGKASVAALVDMYLCTCSSWCVVLSLSLNPVSNEDAVWRVGHNSHMSIIGKLWGGGLFLSRA